MGNTKVEILLNPMHFASVSTELLCSFDYWFRRSLINLHFKAFGVWHHCTFPHLFCSFYLSCRTVLPPHASWTPYSTVFLVFSFYSLSSKLVIKNLYLAYILFLLYLFFLSFMHIDGNSHRCQIYYLAPITSPNSRPCASLPRNSFSISNSVRKTSVFPFLPICQCSFFSL